MGRCLPLELTQKIADNFDKTLEQVLINQADEELKVPIDALSNLPHYCSYIKVNTIEDYDGFFVHFESDTNTKQLELRFLILLNDGDVIPVVLELNEGYTIAECMQKTFITAKKNVPWVSANELKDSQTYALDICSKLLQLVLYICSSNKDIVEDPIQKNIAKQPSAFQFIKDKYREIQKWNLGEKSGILIRENYKEHIKQEQKEKKNAATKQNNSSRGSKAGIPKRPHYRKAHWHHYWLKAKIIECWN